MTVLCLPRSYGLDVLDQFSGQVEEMSYMGVVSQHYSTYFENTDAFPPKR